MATQASASRILGFANLQMASEAFLSDTSGQLQVFDDDSKEDFSDLLNRGNHHASKFPEELAAEFADHWKVLAQKPNTGTGFSGTVFECILDDPANGFKVGETVVSFRSTEFIDDAVRDQQATNKMEISEFGFAFGQIADMEDWYQQLNRPGGELAGKNFYVTGYSLGGHLATAFYRLRRESGAGDRILGTLTFNGAGIGDVKDDYVGKLQSLIAQFDALRQNAGSLIRFDNPALQAVFARMRTTLDGSRPLSDDSYKEFKIAIDGERRQNSATANDLRGCASLVKALDRIRDISVEAIRVNGENGQGGLTDGHGQKPDFVPIALNSTTGKANVDAARLDYQLAVLAVSDQTEGVGTNKLVGLYNILTDARYTSKWPIDGPNDNFYDVLGYTRPSMVANTQRHYGTATRVYIEDQPAYRGNVMLTALVQSAHYLDAKLLVDGYVENDFGDTHSLVLIVDAMAVASVFERLAGPRAPSLDTLTEIFRSATATRKAEVLGTQGTAEGDTLETILDALRKIVIGAEQPRTPSSNSGNT